MAMFNGQFISYMVSSHKPVGANLVLPWTDLSRMGKAERIGGGQHSQPFPQHTPLGPQILGHPRAKQPTHQSLVTLGASCIACHAPCTTPLKPITSRRVLDAPLSPQTLLP
jgi:hypothetical protein